MHTSIYLYLARIQVENDTRFSIFVTGNGFLRHMEELDGDWYGHTALVKGKRIDLTEYEFEKEADWDLSNVKYIDYHPYFSSGKPIDVQKKEYADVIKKMIAEFPMFDNLRYMPRDGQIRCTVGKNPADKVLLGLMLCRNLQKVSRPEGALNFALNRNYPMTVAVLFDTMYSRYEDYRGNNNWTFDPLNEDCIFDPYTGGKKAISDFINQPKGYFPWFQEPFSSMNCGYMRDSDFAKEGEILNDKGVEPEYDEWDDITNYDEISETGETYFRRLVSCFSTYYQKGECENYSSHQ